MMRVEIKVGNSWTKTRGRRENAFDCDDTCGEIESRGMVIRYGTGGVLGYDSAFGSDHYEGELTG